VVDTELFLAMSAAERTLDPVVEEALDARDTRSLAHELWVMRAGVGEPGDADMDWRNARLLQELDSAAGEEAEGALFARVEGWAGRLVSLRVLGRRMRRRDLESWRATGAPGGTEGPG